MVSQLKGSQTVELTLTCGRVSHYAQCRPTADWTRPTHTGGGVGVICSSQSTSSNVDLI